MDSLGMHYKRTLLNVSNNMQTRSFCSREVPWQTFKHSSTESNWESWKWSLEDRKQISAERRWREITCGQYVHWNMQLWKGQEGSSCAHQSAVVAKYKIPSVNCFPSLRPLARQAVAKLAIGDKAKVDIDFVRQPIRRSTVYDQDIETGFEGSDDAHLEEGF